MEFFSWDVLGTIAGATAVVTIVLSIIQYLFGSGMNEKIRNAVVVVVSVAIIVAVEVSAGGGLWEDYVLAVLNGLVVALASLRLVDTTVPKAVLLTKSKE